MTQATEVMSESQNIDVFKGFVKCKQALFLLTTGNIYKFVARFSTMLNTQLLAGVNAIPGA